MSEVQRNVHVSKPSKHRKALTTLPRDYPTGNVSDTFVRKHVTNTLQLTGTQTVEPFECRTRSCVNENRRNTEKRNPPCPEVTRRVAT
jgi:hypothetical protein